MDSEEHEIAALWIRMSRRPCWDEMCEAAAEMEVSEDRSRWSGSRVVEGWRLGRERRVVTADSTEERWRPKRMMW